MAFFIVNLSRCLLWHINEHGRLTTTKNNKRFHQPVQKYLHFKSSGTEKRGGQIFVVNLTYSLSVPHHFPRKLHQR